LAHHRLREDKTCLNCGTVVGDRYCPHCGQENVEPRESLGHLVRHFFEDITHFDSKFFGYFRDLLLRPGYLTREYMDGKRVSHYNPVRAYIFISFIFFLVLFSGKKHESPDKNQVLEETTVKKHIADSLRTHVKNSAATGMADSIRNSALRQIATQLDPDTVSQEKVQSVNFAFSGRGVRFILADTRYRDLTEYDSVQKNLPDTSRLKDKGIMKLIIRTNIRLKTEYGNKSAVILEQNFKQSVPKIMFVLLPVFALYIMLFHRRRTWRYPQHVIFSIHYHSFLFLLFMLTMFLGWIISNEIFALVMFILLLLIMFFYLVMALKNTYRQSFIISFLKGSGIALIYLVTLAISFFLLALGTFLLA
jgi:hypothetical protein